MKKIFYLFSIICFTINAQNISVSSGNSFTIEKGGSVTVSGDFSNTGTFTLNSDADEFASIIVAGSSSGDIVYNRYVNTVGSGEWDLVGSPVDGLSIDAFVTANSSGIAESGSSYAFGFYDNAANVWNNYTTSSVANAGNFDIGSGYQMATNNGETLAFTGTIATTDQGQSIINNNGNGGRRWNLVANPFPSYLKATNGADATNNFLKVNSDSGVIDNDAFSAIYGWNADGSGYTPYNHTSGSVYLAPGQGFFVAAASASSANLSFTQAMQTITGGDDFVGGRMANTSSSFHLKLYEDGDFIAETKFYFDSNLTLGLDPGYDAGAFDQSMALMSRLVEDDQGVGMSINAMGLENFEQTAVPLVVNRDAGQPFRISLQEATIPESVELYLEDTQAQSFTNLRTEDFMLNPQTDLSGMGRFYLRMGSTNLGGNEVDESYISIYKASNEDFITIEGLVNFQIANVRLFNIMGQEVIYKSLSPNESAHRVSTLALSAGVYIIRLEADSSTVIKKLIID